MPQFLSQTKAKVIFQSAQCWIIDGFIAFNLLNNTTLTSMVWSEPFAKSSAQESLFYRKNEKFHEIWYLKLGYFWATCQAISQFHIYDLRLGCKYPLNMNSPSVRFSVYITIQIRPFGDIWTQGAYNRHFTLCIIWLLATYQF